MDTYSQYSDPHPFGSNSEASPLSDGRSGQASHSDEEVVLASNRPKKRAGRRVFKETRHPVYRGVRQRNRNKWVCELREPNKKTRIWLGTYPTAEMAARAHDVAALALKGRLACLNFADSTWLPLPTSKDAKDIRRAAAEAAEAFRQREYGGEVPTASSSNMSIEDAIDDRPENVVYVDEEALFDMPGLMMSMAEGLLLSPPPCLGSNSSWGEVEAEGDLTLWSF